MFAGAFLVIYLQIWKTKVKYIIDKLKSLQRYDFESSIFGDTLCKHREGDYVQWDDIENLINEIEKG